MATVCELKVKKRIKALICLKPVTKGDILKVRKDRIESTRVVFYERLAVEG